MEVPSASFRDVAIVIMQRKRTTKVTCFMAAMEFNNTENAFATKSVEFEQSECRLQTVPFKYVPYSVAASCHTLLICMTLCLSRDSVIDLALCIGIIKANAHDAKA